MADNYSSAEDILTMKILIAVLIVFILIGYWVNSVIPFLNARRMIKNEMRRSEGNEYYYWKRKLKKLYLSHIPLIRRFFR